MRKLAAALAASAGLLLAPAGEARAAPGTALGVPCVASGGIRICEGTLATRVPSWDGTPLDVTVTLPPESRPGPYPLIVALHGFGANKTFAFDGPPSEPQRYAREGYATLTYTARGLGLSCGLPVSRAHPGCVRGWIHLADARYEGRDTQYLAGRLVDEGLARPAIGVTGTSYGGGQSLMLASLRDRMMLPDGRLVPWRSPNGTPMRIAAAAPKIGWSDLAYALVPTGRTLDHRASNPYGPEVGIVKQSYLTGLFAVGLSGYYAPPGADPEADVITWKAALDKGEPYEGPVIDRIRRQFERFRSSYYLQKESQDAGGGPPAPVVIYNGFLDDIMPADEALRYAALVRSRFPDAALGMIFGPGFAHNRGSLTEEPTLMNHARDELFRRYLKGDTKARPLKGVIATTQGCHGAPELGPFRTASWGGQHPGRVVLQGGAAQSFDSEGGNPVTAAQLDPFLSGACPTVRAARDPGAATYRLPPAHGRGYTLLGSPTVRATFTVSGDFPQVAARLWDVAPDGRQTLITRGLYRPDRSGAQVFQLHPNGWHFRPGHAPKLELLGRDQPYAQPSNGSFRIRLSGLRLELPVREAMTASVAPARRCLSARARAGRRGIGRIRLGRTRSRLRRLPVMPPRRTSYSYRYCVKRRSGRVSAIFSSRARRARSRLVVTTARGHGGRRAGVGSRARRFRRGYRRRVRIGRGLYRAGPRSRRIFGVRRGRVRFIAVADRSLLRNRRALRRALRRGGVR